MRIESWFLYVIVVLHKTNNEFVRCYTSQLRPETMIRQGWRARFKSCKRCFNRWWSQGFQMHFLISFWRSNCFFIKIQRGQFYFDLSESCELCHYIKLMSWSGFWFQKYLSFFLTLNIFSQPYLILILGWFLFFCGSWIWASDVFIHLSD